MLESTFDDQHQKRVTWYVVFDSRDGRVVHIHQFIDDDTYTLETEAPNNRTRMALQVAERYCDPTYLRVLHAPPNFSLEPGAMCRVDLASGELVMLAKPQSSLREFVERARLARESKPTAT